MLSLLLSCDNNDDNQEPEIQNETNKVALLKIDFLTNTFEGGKQFEFAPSSSFTISSTYNPPGDFGDVQLYYSELDEIMFDGTIHWMGLGGMSYPTEIAMPEDFATVGDALPLPSESEFQKVMYVDYAYYPDAIDYESIWNAINNLEIVSSFRESNPNGDIHLFLYTPSVGVGNPEDWDWYIFMKN